MGDIFEYLFGGITYSEKRNKKIIDKINELALSIEIYYFEGNHDFNLKKLFPNIVVFPLQSQPVLFTQNKKKILISHGDWNENIGYKIYSSIIRNPIVLLVLNTIDNCISNKISKKIISNQMTKNKCYKIQNFKSKIQHKIKNIEVDIIIEGHYHQDKTYILRNTKYINLPAFVCLPS